MKHLFATSLLLMIILGGCLSDETASNSIQGEKTFPINLDNYGENITIDAPPERIVSLAPSNTEILFALELGEKVVGVTEHADYPEKAKQKEKIGGFKTVNIEKVVSLNPDLVLATGGVQAEMVQKLRELGLTVVVMDAKDIDEILENIRLVGRITGKNKKARVLVDDLEERVDAVKTRAAVKSYRPKVAYIVWGDPIMVAGRDTFINDLIDLAGGINVFSDSQLQYPTVSMESMIERDPSILINGDHSGITPTSLKNEPEWMEISAVKNDRLYTSQHCVKTGSKDSRRPGAFFSVD
jgi:iron complex transport system substrate-binding protein